MNIKNFNTILEAFVLQKKIVIFTGAGISVESGIPPYRGKDGVWTKESKKIAKKTRSELFLYLKEMHEQIQLAEPNLAHMLISNLQYYNPNIHIITQNIDQLHQKAGNKNVLELHGTFNEQHCDDCKTEVLADVQTCPKCGGFIRPSVVWFGENIKSSTILSAVELVKQADLFLSIGTSAQVYPAASLILLAQDLNIPTFEINPETTEISEHIKEHIPSTASAFIKLLYKEVVKQSIKREKNERNNINSL